jgi:hypothetical protein
MLPVSARGLAAILACAALCGATSAQADPATYRYQAKAGDTLIALGQSLLANPADWPKLQKLNHIRDPRHIPVGQDIAIPVELLRWQSLPGQVVAVSGAAQLVQAGRGAPLLVNTAWTPGSEIHTAGDGHVTVKLADGSLLKINSASMVRLERTQHYERPGFFATALQVIQGRVEAAVAHMTGGEPRFQVKTPQATLGVRGTDFRVAAMPETQTSLGEVLTGKVAVAGAAEDRKARKEVSLVAGQGLLVDAQQQVGQPVALAAAPDLSRLPALHERPLVRLSVPAVPGAKSYRAQVATDADFNQVAAEVTSPTPELRIAGLSDGHYHLRVRAGNAQGLEGLESRSAFTLKARPEPPHMLAPAAKAKHRGLDIPLQWTEPDQAQRYHLQISVDGNWAQPLVEKQDLAQSSLTQSLPPGSYQWRLASIRADGNQGPFGDVQSFTLLPPPATVPPPKVDEKTLSFTWSGEPGQTFLLQMARNAEFTDGLSSLNTTEPQASLPRPEHGGRLWVRTRATDADGYVGPFSAPQSLYLPTCMLDGQGQCLHAGDGSTIRSH